MTVAYLSNNDTHVSAVMSIRGKQEDAVLGWPWSSMKICSSSSKEAATDAVINSFSSKGSTLSGALWTLFNSNALLGGSQENNPLLEPLPNSSVPSSVNLFVGNDI